MKLLAGRTLPSMKTGFLFGVLVIILGVSPTNIATASESVTASSEAASENYQDNWWRSVRQGMWEWEGADWSVIRSALVRIEQASGKRRYPDKVDTIIKYGPGHWVYEWSRIGEKAYKQGLKQENKGDTVAARRSFLNSSIYYTQGSYPHLRDKHSRAALAKAFEMYKRAGRYFSVPMEEWELEVDGARFKAFVHFPESPTSKPIPVILKTGGMDVLSTEFYPLSETITEYGAAMIVYDSPGTGNDGIVDSEYDKHHVAVLKRVLADRRFDAERIGIWSESLAGVTAVKIAIGEHRGSIAAAVNSCGPIHTLYALAMSGEEPTQYDSHELVAAYNKGQLSKQKLAEIQKTMLTPEFEQRLLNFQTETYLDRVRASSDNMMGLLASSLPVSLVDQGLLGKKNITNTPILTINTHFDPLVPLSESQLATDASVQGKLMIIDEYGGHCVSRAEIPLIMEWLAFHLQLAPLGNYVNKIRAVN
ncbi:MAG: alpha/beta hydrolase [bacterium]|nr:alpha/beta hydrolase [Gammaproteobacteria bacterium]